MDRLLWAVNNFITIYNLIFDPLVLNEAKIWNRIEQEWNLSFTLFNAYKENLLKKLEYEILEGNTNQQKSVQMLVNFAGYSDDGTEKN